MKKNGPRKKEVRRSVVIIDRIADWVITVGGITVILAVLGILIYLVQETLPLFQAGDVTATYEYRLDPAPADLVSTGMDEYGSIAYTLQNDGQVHLFHARTGKLLNRFRLDFGQRRLTAFSETVDQQHLAFGFDDGSVQLAELSFPFQILPEAEIPKDLTVLDTQDRLQDNDVYSLLPGGQWRKIRFQLSLEPVLRVNREGKAIVAVDYRVSGEAERQTMAFVTVDSDGNTSLSRINTRVNLWTGAKKRDISQSRLPSFDASQPVHSALLNDRADMVLVAVQDGRIYRFNTTDFEKPQLSEIITTLAPKETLTVLGFLSGQQSVMVGGSQGTLDAFFLVNRKKQGTADGLTLTKARSYGRSGSPVSALTPSSRGKGFAVVYTDGSTSILHGTSQKRLLHFEARVGAETIGLAMSPRFDGLLQVFADGLVRFWTFSVPHPETTFFTLFQKVWYEGFEKPSYTWQSSALTDNYEQKLSLMPLIFGSIKAALYSLLFAVPIAILGAIYTSEFVDYQLRKAIKPVMEMMASLPSVVLGFIAALVLAPIVETWIAAVLAAFITIPLGLVITSFFWQMLPEHLTIRWQGGIKLSLMFLIVLVALAVTMLVGPWLEDLFFNGNFKAWLNRDSGEAEPFLFLVLLPLAFLLVSLFISRLLKPKPGLPKPAHSRGVKAGLDVLRWLCGVGLAVLVAWGLAQVFAFLGFDARDGMVGTYVQRNTLVVGFAMGFAVIPIIYTIAEDALHAVPDHLRAASLGCGATQWQTTIYVVLPAAVSGVFSAVMIGMGRAVGETMIVVMAAGNTPLMDWNIFNGLRALSATIAVELPEAVKDGTLYRVLFLSGLVLFFMTFIINTIAEVVRIRFRKKTTQL